VQSALIALDEAVLNGTPPTMSELVRSSGLPPWSMTVAATTLEHAGLTESERGRLYLTNSGAACAETLRRQHPWRPATLKSSPDTEIII
jgi:DNA-binding IclR family transcriptional regulator